MAYRLSFIVIKLILERAVAKNLHRSPRQFGGVTSDTQMTRSMTCLTGWLNCSVLHLRHKIEELCHTQ